MFELITVQVLLFIHLMCFAAAIFLVLRADVQILRQEMSVDAPAFHKAQRLITRLLIVLWVTGVFLVLFAVEFHPEQVLENPKLVAKIAAVAIVTINGVLLHYIAFPMMTKSQKHPEMAASICAVLGAVSTSSWLYASFLGAARVISPVMTLKLFMGLYLVCTLLAVLISLIIVKPRISLMIPRAPKELRGRRRATRADRSNS